MSDRVEEKCGSYLCLGGFARYFVKRHIIILEHRFELGRQAKKQRQHKNSDVDTERLTCVSFASSTVNDSVLMTKTFV